MVWFWCTNNWSWTRIRILWTRFGIEWKMIESTSLKRSEGDCGAAKLNRNALTTPDMWQNQKNATRKWPIPYKCYHFFPKLWVLKFYGEGQFVAHVVPYSMRHPNGHPQPGAEIIKIYGVGKSPKVLIKSQNLRFLTKIGQFCSKLRFMVWRKAHFATP